MKLLFSQFQLVGTSFAAGAPTLMDPVCQQESPAELWHDKMTLRSPT